MSARRLIVGAALVAALAAAAPAAALRPTVAIPSPLEGPLPRFTGAAVAANPLPWSGLPANPLLAPEGRSGSGLVPGNGAASPFPGPLGRGTTRRSVLQAGTCASLAFDGTGRLLGLCNGVLGPSLTLFDPATLAPITSLMLPPRLTADRTDLAGGTHFIVRADGSLLVPTTNGTLITIAVGASTLRQTSEIDLRPVLAKGERVFAVGSGYDGREWAAGNKGSVVAVPRDGGKPLALDLKEPVAEDIATDPSGTYVVTRDALYRLQANGPGGRPAVAWRQPVAPGVTDPHSGRLHPGSGTPPAIVEGGYVAVADGANPPRIDVMRIAGRDSRRMKCSVPVFTGGKGSIEAHLVVAENSIVATNAYGYDSLATTEFGGTTTGGIARVDIHPGGCRIAWTSDQISPSAQPVVSRSTGLLYTLLKPAGFPDRWNLGAIDWRTGKLHFSVLAGEGLGHNSEGGAVVLAPDGAAYAGSFGGVTRFRDSP